MDEKQQNADEPMDAGGGQPPYSKSRRPFSKLATELETADLESKGVQKMILAEISRLENEVVELRGFEEQFHVRDKLCAVLEEQRKRDTSVEILYTVAISVGSGLVGWLPSSQTTGALVTVTIFAVALFAFAIFAKWKGSLT